jgi:hypothetical protein
MLLVPESSCSGVLASQMGRLPISTGPLCLLDVAATWGARLPGVVYAIRYSSQAGPVSSWVAGPHDNAATLLPVLPWVCGIKLQYLLIQAGRCEIY